jgi:hypothetical protein
MSSSDPPPPPESEIRKTYSRQLKEGITGKRNRQQPKPNVEDESEEEEIHSVSKLLGLRFLQRLFIKNLFKHTHIIHF